MVSQGQDCFELGACFEFKCQNYNSLIMFGLTFLLKAESFSYRGILKRSSCRPCGPEDVSQEEKEEARDFRA